MAEVKIVQAREPFSVNLPDGSPLIVATGDRFYADDPAVLGREQLFGEVTVRSTRPRPPAGAETASAAPGTRRSRTKGEQAGA